jgi:hypothetical protein
LPNDNRFPVWSPDGSQVAFFTQGAGVMTLRADGSERTPRRLRSDTLGPMVWSAAGELLCVASPGDIFAVPAAPSDQRRPVVVTDSVEYDPALSPDGNWLAYVSNRTGASEVWVQRYPEGVAVRVSNNGGYEPLWATNGHELYYRQGDAIMKVAVQTAGEFSFEAPQQLFSGRYLQSPSAYFRSYDVARDGRFLMILPDDKGSTAVPASIVVVQNFAEELKRRVRPSGEQDKK